MFVEVVVAGDSLTYLGMKGAEETENVGTGSCNLSFFALSRVNWNCKVPFLEFASLKFAFVPSNSFLSEVISCYIEITEVTRM